MEPEFDPVIGIVGGMGPQAGLALFNSIMRQTNAATDQQHLSTILMSFPRHIVDRTAFLEGVTDINPGFSIAAVIQKLERAGASIAGISCNTSHCPRIFEIIVRELRKQNSSIQLLNMPLETCACIRERYPGARRIGLMTTNGTYRSGIYSELLKDMGYEVVLPDLAFQCDVIHRMIYDPAFGLKANAGKMNRTIKMFTKKTMQYFGSMGTDAVILGCTDLSVLQDEPLLRQIPVVDSTESLARALVKKAQEARILRNDTALIGHAR